MADLSKLSDKELILANLSDASGVPGANKYSGSGCVAELISRYMKLVFSLAKKYSGCADYEELVSDGMAGLLSAVKNYDEGKGEFSSFAAVCVDNRLKNTVRRSIKRAKRLADEEELSLVADGKPTPEERIIEKENSEAMLRVIENELTELEFKCIQGVAMGLSYAEMAGRLGVDKKSVDNALSRARSKLRGIYGL